MNKLFVIVIVFTAILIITITAIIITISLSPTFNDYGEINECVGCNGCAICDINGNIIGYEDDLSCKYNPKYWQGYKYIGPSNKELRKLKKK